MSTYAVCSGANETKEEADEEEEEEEGDVQGFLFGKLKWVDIIKLLHLFLELEQKKIEVRFMLEITFFATG